MMCLSDDGRSTFGEQAPADVEVIHGRFLIGTSAEKDEMAHIMLAEIWKLHNGYSSKMHRHAQISA